jgi:hypothetical protein
MQSSPMKITSAVSNRDAAATFSYRVAAGAQPNSSRAASLSQGGAPQSGDDVERAVG